MIHGKRATYIKGCRCASCSEASREYYRAYTATYRGNTARKKSVIKNRLARKEWLNSIKTQSGCVDCGYNTHPEVLQFDHLEDKTFGISSNRNLAKSRILEEIKKCQVVCANCHIVRTTNRAREKTRLR